MLLNFVKKWQVSIPAEMEIMESFEVVQTTKTEIL
jgi:hypothetical protein